jgi:hypothetical protein
MRYMLQDYITFQGHSIEVAYAFMLTDLEKLFHRSGSSLVKYGFPPAPAVPTELDEACSIWMNVNVMTRQEQLLQSLNESLPNNLEQQQAFDSIMESVDRFKDSNRDDITQHEFHFHRSAWGDR